MRRLQLETLEERVLLATRIWDGGGADANWATAANWVGDVAPVEGDDLIFGPGAAQLAANNNFAPGTFFKSVTISAAGYTIGGNAIQLLNGITATHVAGISTWNVPLTLVNYQSFVVGNPGATLVLGGAIDTGDLAGNNQVSGNAFAISAILVDGAGDLAISGAIGGQGGIRKLGSGTLFLSGPNTYEGLTQIEQGVVNVSHNTGLGAATGATTVFAGAALQVQGTITVAEPLAISEAGIGFGNGLDPTGMGALRAVNGANVTWSGGIELIGGNNLIGVDGGSFLNVSGAVIGQQLSTRNLVKVGAGTLRFSGATPNAFLGTTTVLQGTLELGKTAGVQAIGGALTIGDNIGGDNAAVVRLLANGQIPHLDLFQSTLLTVTLNSSGLLDLNGFSDEIGNLTLTTGTTYSADVVTGAGTLTLMGIVTVNGFQGSSGASPAARIAFDLLGNPGGNLNLGSHFSGAGGSANRFFNINDTQLNNVAPDLIVSVNISGPADVALVKQGAGTLQLSGNNTFTGGVIHNGGLLFIGSNTALGTGQYATQNNGNVLAAVNGNWTLANPISLDSNLTFFLPNNLTFTGLATLTGDRTMLVMDAAQTVTFAGGISEGIFGSQNFRKSGPGTLAITAPATYSGSTIINDDGGIFELRDSGTLTNTNFIQVGVGATLLLNNRGLANLPDRINDLTRVDLSGGTFAFLGAAGAASTETLGLLTLGFTGVGNSANTVFSDPGAGGSAVVTFAALSQANAATVDFRHSGNPFSATGNNRISFIDGVSPPNIGGNTLTSLDDGILPFATISDALGTDIDFVTVASSPEGLAVVALPPTGYFTDIVQAGPNSNVKITVPGVYTLTTSKSINALILGPGVTLAGPGAALTINAGALLFAGGGASAISVDSINLGGGFVTVRSGTDATISGNIFAGSVLKAGGGRLILSGVNQYTGSTVVNEGVLQIQRSEALGAPAAVDAGGSTFVRPNAVLELNQTTFGPINVLAEGLRLVGGTFNVGGVLRNLAGNNSWAGNVNVSGASVNVVGLLGGLPLINGSVVSFDTAPGTNLTITGAIGSGVSDLIKRGTGTLTYAGVLNNGYGQTRVYEGVLVFNKEIEGLNAVNSNVFVGSDGPGAPAATLVLANSNQIPDGVTLLVHSTGQVNVGNSQEVIGAFQFVISNLGGGTVQMGANGLLSITDITVFTQGAGNPTGARVLDGTLALQRFGTISAPGARTFQVNDGAAGDDLTISSAIVDGTGLQSVGVTKTGFGTLVFSGTTANTYTGTTTVSEGELALAKTAGVNALMGPITVGDTNPQSGFANSDILRLRAADQLPDFLTPMTINNTGLFDLNGFNETFGNTDLQTAVTLNMGNIFTGAGTLTVNGNIVTVAGQGAVLFTPFGPPTISGNLNLGAVSRIIDVQDQVPVPIDAIISANISGSGGVGIVKNNNGLLLLSGNNTYSGDTFLNTGGHGVALGSNTALGTGTVFVFSSGNNVLLAFGGARSIANPIILPNGQANLGIWNDLTFTGQVNATGGTSTIGVLNAVTVDFAGGFGELYGSTALSKVGIGRLVFSSAATYSGVTILNFNTGSLILRGQGTILNTTGIDVQQYSSLIIDNNSGGNLTDRVADVDVRLRAGSTLHFIGVDGGASSEFFRDLILTSNTPSNVQAQAGAGGTSAITFRNLNRENPQATVDFYGFVQDLGLTNQINFYGTVPGQTCPGLIDNIIPYATVREPHSRGLNLASYGFPGSFVFALPDAGYVIDTFAGATAGSNVKLTTSAAAGANQTVQALLIVGNGITVSGGPLTVSSGAVVAGSNDVTTVAASTISSDLNFAAAQGILNVKNNTTLTVSGTIPATTTGGVLKTGLGTAVLSGANAFTGAVNVTEGVLNVQNSTALGSVAQGTTIFFGAQLEVQGGVAIGTEPLDLQSRGLFLSNRGGLRNVSGNNSWAGNVTINTADSAITVAQGGDTLTLSGVIAGGGRVNKFGLGTLEYAGGAANTNTSQLWVAQGTLLLNKSGGNVAVNGQLFIGDFAGGDNADQVVYAGSAGTDQIGAVTVIIASSGLLNLNGISDTINTFDLRVGPASSADIMTGTGVLTLNGNVTVNVFAGGTPVAATITGLLDLGTASRIFTINDSAAVEDLVISADISSAGGAFGLTKTANGRMVLSGNNTYTGVTLVNQGELSIKSNTALGLADGTAASRTEVSPVNNGSAALLIDASLTVGDEFLDLGFTTGFGGGVGGGIAGTGILRSLSGNSTWGTGTTTVQLGLLAGTTATQNIVIGVDAGSSLRLNATVSQTTGINNNLIKTLGGTLELAGTAANTYLGNTTVNEGILRLNKTPGLGTGGGAIVAGTLTIGNDLGGNNADQVQLGASNQIADTVAVVVTSSGLLDLVSSSETLGTAGGPGNVLDLRVNTRYSAMVNVGTGTLTLGGPAGVSNVIVQQVGGSLQDTRSPGAAITDLGSGGQLNLGNVARTFTVNDAGLNIRELVIDAVINGGGAGGAITRSGAGLMVINSNNAGTLSGVTTLNAGGGIVIGHNNALGTGDVNVAAATSIFTVNYDGVPSPITLPNNIILNADLTVRGDENFTFSGTITNSGANRNLNLNVNNAVTATFSGFINLSNDATSRTLVINSNTFNNVSVISGVIQNGGGSTASALTKAGVGILQLSNANTFGGVVTVNNGILRVTNANALAPGSNTVVNGAATLEITGGLNISEALVLQAQARGFAFERGALLSTGAAPNTWSGTITLGNGDGQFSVIGVAAGSNLTVTGVISQSVANVGLIKAGTGTLRLGNNAGAANTYAGETIVRAGTLELFKPAGTNAFGGGLTIGDHGGGMNADRVVLLAGEQIPNGITITINASGQLNLGAFTETMGPLTFNRILNASGSVVGAGTLINTANNITVQTAGQAGAPNNTATLFYTDPTTPAALFAAATLDLNAANPRVFNVTDTILPGAADDFIVSGIITNGGVQKDGGGTMVFTNANTYTQQTIVNGAINLVGINTVVSGTLLLRGMGRLGPNANTVTVQNGGTLVLDNTAANFDRIFNTAPVTLSGGTLHFIGNALGTTEQFAGLTLNANTSFDNTILSTTNGGLAQLLGTTMTRNAGASLELIGIGADLGSASNEIRFTGAVPFVNGVLPFATVLGPAGFDLVRDVDSGVQVSLGRVLVYDTINTPNGNVKLTADAALTANNTINALLIDGTGIDVTGPFTLGIGTATAGLVAVRGTTNTIQTPLVNFAGLEPLFLIESGSDLNVGSTINGTGAMRKERDGTLILAGDNDQGAGQQFTGGITVNQGTLVARHSDAFGTVAGGVTVNNMAALVLDAIGGPLTVGNETLNLAGTGEFNNNTGVLRAINGASTWGTGATAVNYNTNPVIINVGAASTLTLNANIGGVGFLTKIGPGELVYTGASDNGNVQPVVVNEGTMTLNKPAANRAIRGQLTINDLGNFDPAGGATVQYAATAGTNQIDNVVVIVQQQGLFDMNGISDVINQVMQVNGGQVVTGGANLTVTGLTITGGSVDTAGGTLFLNGTLTYNSGLATNGPATINGTLDLGGATRTITVNDGVFFNDLTINAQITNGRVVKNGAGVLRLSNAANAFLAPVSEVQTITFSGATPGTTQFNLTFNGFTSVSFLYDGTTAPVQAALDSILGAGNTLVTGGPTTFTVTFQGQLAGFDVPAIGGAITVAPGTISFATPTGGAAGFTLDAGTLALSSNTALGGANLHVRGSSQLLPEGGNLALANAVVINNNVTFTLGGRRDFGGTLGVNLSGPVFLLSSNSSQVINLNVNDLAVNAEISGVISSTSSPAAGNLILTKTGIGRLIFSGTNTYRLRTDINGGFLNVRNSSGLGAPASTGGVVVVRGDSAGGTVLELEDTGGGLNINKNLFLFFNSGATIFGYLQNIVGLGAPTGMVRNVTGNNTWTGDVDLRAANSPGPGTTGTVFIRTEAGSSLNINGAIVGSGNDGIIDEPNRNLLKVGGGTLRFSGATANQINNTHAVLEGTLELNKSGGVDAIAGGTLIVGDNVGGNDSDQLVVVAGASNDQINNNTNVQVQTTGLFNLNGITDQINALTQVAGVAAGDVATGAGTLIATGYTLNVRPGEPTTTALISGTINLGTADKFFTVNKGSGAVELLVTAAIVENAAAGIIKAGLGRLVLDPAVASTFTGVVTLNASGGAVTVRQNSSLGAAGGAVTVGTGSALELDNNVTIVGETVTLNGSGLLNGTLSAFGAAVLGTGALRNVGGTNTWQGGVTLGTNPASVAVDGSTTLTINGVIGGGGNGLVKTGTGTLVMSGAANTYTGQTTVVAGTLNLNKTTGPAILGTLVVGDGLGGNDADQVIYGAGGDPNQIGAVTVTVHSTGRLDLNGQTDAIGALNLGVGAASADILTGAGSLILGGNVATLVQAGTTAGSPAALVTGNLDLGANRIFTVNEGLGNIELSVNGTVLGGAAITLTKNGFGTLEFAGTGNNTYGGLTLVNSGILLLNKAGFTAIAGNLTIGDDVGAPAADVVRLLAAEQIINTSVVTVNSTGWLDLNSNNETIASLIIRSGTQSGGLATTGTGALTVNGAITHTVVGSGQSGAVISGILDLGGAVQTFTVADNIGSIPPNAFDLAIIGEIRNGGVTKNGAGTLLYGGAQSNTYVGTTTVNAGTLLLAKTGGATAIAGNLIVGDNAGGDNADVVRVIGSNQIADTSAVTVNSSGLLDYSGTNEQQLVIVQCVNGGTFTLTVPGFGTTIPLAFNVAAAVMQTALEALLGAGNVLVVGTPSPALGTAGIYLVTFVRDRGEQDIGLMTTDSTALLPAGLGMAEVRPVQDGVPGTGFSDTIGSLTLVSGSTFGADVNMGSGLLTLGGNVTLNVNGTGLVGAQLYGNLDLGGATRTFTVSNGGSANPFDLAIFGSIGNGALTKDGLGTLMFAGAAVNTYTGLTTVNAGELILNKPAGTTAIAGDLLIGDGAGGANADIVRLVASDQIADTSAVTVSASGLLDMTLDPANVQVTEVQVIYLVASAAPGGNFTITVPGFGTTGLIPGAATAAQVQAALGALVGAANVAVTGVAGTGGPTPGIYLVTFQGTLAGVNIGLMTINTVGITTPANNVAGVAVTVVDGATNLAETIGSLDGAVGSNVKLGNGTLTTGFLNTNAVFNGVIAGPGGNLTKIGTGVFTLGGTNTYTGTTNVNAGSLIVNGSIANSIALGVQVNAGGTLGGTGDGLTTGIIFAPVTVNAGGILNPGDFGLTGLLTVQNNVTFNAGGLLFLDIFGTTPVTQYDQLRITGTGAVTINAGALVDGNTTFNPVNGVDTFIVIDKQSAGLITGNFANAVPPSPPNQVFIGIKSYLFTYTGNTGNDFVLTADKTTRVWDGGSPLDNNWTSDLNWLNDRRPVAGDDLVFNDIGVTVRPNPFNDYAPGTAFATITLSTTLGSYTLGGNPVLLDAAGGGLFNLQGTNTVNLGLLTATNPQTFSSGVGTIYVNGGVTLGSNLTLDGAGLGVICSPITESVPGMSITKVGSGTWILCGSNTYTGPTILVSGTLQIDGNQPASPVQVFGGTLTGSGVIGPLTTFGGTVQPGGANGGTLTVVGNATFNPATTIVLSFTTRLAVTGDVDLANSQLVFITNIACNPGDQVTLIASGGVNPISGIFAGLPQGSILHINGERLRINYQGVDGNDVILVCLPGVDPIVTGADAGGLPHVKLFDPRTGSVRMSFLAYDAGFRGGVRVALGDVNGDGFDDIITGSGPGTIAHVRVFDGRTGALIKNFFASGFAGGIYVGSGDVNGDGFADIIVGLGAGAASLIQVFDGRSTALIKNFFAFGAFTGGVRVAGGDLNGDGFDEILAGTGPGIAAEVRVFDGRSTALIKNFYPFGFFLGGIFVAAGDVNGDSFDDILVGADQGPPHVMVFDALTTAVLKSFYAYNPLSTGQLAEVPTTNVWRAGVRVAAADVNGDGFADIVTAPGPIPAPEVKVFDSLFLTVLDDFFAYDPYFRGGVFVGG